MQLSDTSLTTTHTTKDETCKASSTTANSNDHDVRLGWILVNKNLISEDQLNTALNNQPTSSQQIGELLTEQQLISEQQLQQALQEQYWRRNGYWIIE